MPDPTSSASDLIRSRTRLEILERLRESEATKYDLRDEFECVRTTVDRNLDHLVSEGWVTESDGGYEITTSGKIVLERATAFVDTVEAAARLQPILQYIPRDGIGVDVRELADAEVTLPSAGQPVAMVDKHVDAIAETTTARMVLPVVSPQPLAAQTRKSEQGDISTELVVTPTVAEVLTTEEEFTRRIGELRTEASVAIHVTNDPVPYYLGILDETVQIGVDDDGDPCGLLESESEDVLDWAEARFESYKQSAVPLTEWTDGQEV